MLEGQTGHDIVEAIALNLPGYEPRELLRLAGKHFETTSTADSALLLGWCMEATRDLYRRMIEIGDYPNALRAIKQMRDLSK